MPSLVGLKKLLALWNRYNKGQSASSEHVALWKVFGYLKDLRTWSAKDRIDPSITKYIQAMLSAQPDRPVIIEIDFWYRSEKQRHDNSLRILRTMLDEVQGKLLDQVDIPEIRYQGVLVEVPGDVARKLTQSDGSLARFDDIMTIRPQSAYSSLLSEDDGTTSREFSKDLPTRRCITAILDGYPIAQHQALINHLHIHEVEVTGAGVPLTGRYHGTAMTSLIVHGDLHNHEASLSRKVVAVPVLTASLTGRETTPYGKLPIGVIYRSINSLLNAGKTNAELANVTIINHSLCDTYSPFVRRPSPWGTLLDYFSHKYRLLFVISSGNIFESFPVPNYADLNAFQSADPSERQAALLNALHDSKATRGILSPAESINNLTVGALHADGGAPSLSIDPYPSLEMTNLASSIGFGVNRSLKPDIVEQGGRFAAGCSNTASGGIEVYAQAAPDLGHLVAAPSLIGELTHMARTAGTSNAAAIITRSCNQIADAVEDAYASEEIDWLTLKTRAAILKVLIAHGCGWGSIGQVLEDSYPPPGWQKRRDTVAKFLGYGRPRLNRVVDGGENRITLLADDVIRHDKLHEYRVPLPSAMLNTRDVRSITITLAWSTPVIATSSDYRGVALALVDTEGKREFWDGVERILQPNGHTGNRGTLIHLTLEGKKLKKMAIEGGIYIGVQAMARHFSQMEADIPYALAVTLEMAQSQNTKIYAEVRSAIQARAAQRTRVGAR
jgi:hypothetical protein